jgi:hypothetical protein
LVGLSSQTACGAWVATSLNRGTDKPPRVMSNFPETNANIAVDRRRYIFDDRIFDAVEVGPVRLPVIRVAHQLNSLVRLEFDEFEHADDPGARVGDGMLPALLIFHMWTAPSLQGVLQCFDQIACVHMSGLFVRSHMHAGQDGFRDKSSKQNGDLVEATGKCGMSFVVDRLITPSAHSCKFWHQLSTVAVELLAPVSG